MFRHILVLSELVAISLIGVYSPNVSNASPSEGGAAASCSFVLSPPKVVQVSGSSMVLATVKPGPCSLDGIPNQSIICVSIQGDVSPGQCGNRPGTDPAWVYYPYQPGATYVVTGRGCVDIFQDPDHPSTGPVHTTCQSLGPFLFAL